MEIVQVGRQPILDRKLNTFGYELLYRENSIGPSPDMDGDLLTARTVLHSFLEFGLQKIAGPSHQIFINLTKTFFTEMQPLPLDTSRLVLEVLEDIRVDESMIEGIRRMRKHGYQIALDDYLFDSRWEPLLPYVSIIKVDIRRINVADYADNVKLLKQRGITLLAEKVETKAEFEQTLSMGFDLFQGYFFAKPEILSDKRLQTNQKVLLKMLSRINDPACSMEELSSLISKDPKLSFKILRFINSAAINVPNKIDSIQRAVVCVGMNRLRAWATLFIMAGISNLVREVITTGLVRAEFCHSMSKTLEAGDPDSAYTIGLLSVLDSLLGQPMEELVKEMPLPAEMTAALIGHSGPYSQGLNCILALEQYRWLDQVTRILPVGRLNDIYINALARAEEIRHALS